MNTARLGLFLFLIAVVATTLGAEGCTQLRDGCKIDNDRCVCGNGCYTEFRYNSRNECNKALRATLRDICQKNPCRQGGTCSQISSDPGFKCRCEGTGYYGLRCHKQCPKLTDRLTSEYPFECIIV